MPNRILREGILTSERVNSLTWEEEVFYRRLMSVVDDFGRFSAHPSLLRAALYPLKLDNVRDANMERLLAAVEQAHLVRVYEVSGKRYVEMIDFRQQVRAKESKFPNPQDVADLLHSSCVADEKQPPADAHLGGGGGVVVVVDEIGGGGGDVGGATHPPACGLFRMHDKWNPSINFASLARQASLPIPGQAEFDLALAEFISYWLTQPRTCTQHEWDHALLKSLKADRQRGGTKANTEKPWYIVASGIEQKGAELGIKLNPEKGFPDFKHRVLQHAGVTEDMLRKARQDFGVTA